MLLATEQTPSDMALSVNMHITEVPVSSSSSLVTVAPYCNQWCGEAYRRRQGRCLSSLHKYTSFLSVYLGFKASVRYENIPTRACISK